MVAAHSAPHDDDKTPEQPATKVVEKRVGTTVIRRRAKVLAPEELTTAAPAAETAEAVAQPDAPVAAGAASAASATPETTPVAPAPRPGLRTVPAKPALAGHAAARAGVQPEEPAADVAAALRKPTRKKKSRAELEEEEIRRAGGLLHYVAAADTDTADIAEEDAIDEAEVAAVDTEVAAVPAEASSEASTAIPDTPEVVAPAPQPFRGPSRTASIPGARVERIFRPGVGRRKRSLRRDLKKTKITNTKESKRVIRIKERITVGDLSQQLGIKASALVKQLVELGIMATVNQAIDADTAALIAQEYSFVVERTGVNEEELLTGSLPTAAEGTTRPPVVTVMGHVDHGKTSILDAVRKSNVAAGEAGGITQHIGASEIQTAKGPITFIDTPGHEAFTALRARGAQVTDIVILVVAADDGVMPQTIEAINHAKAAEVPIVVAINKMDKPDANPDRVKRELSEHGVVTEEWGGEAICVPTSAKSGAGIDQLLDMVHLQAEVLDLRADAVAPASGTVIEAKLDRGRGPVATILVQSGTLRRGAPVVCGTCVGRVRVLIDSAGRPVERVGPGHAAEILGLDAVPTAGDAVVEAADDKSARLVAESRQRKARETEQGRGNARVSLEDLQQQLAAGLIKTLNVIIKGDVQGSVEAVASAVEKIESAKVNVKVIHRGVGGVTESDVLLAVAAGAVIIGFNVAPESKARGLAERERVTIKTYAIIYELIDDIKKAMVGLLEPKRTEKIMGHASVRQVFKVSKVGSIAGCVVTDGTVSRAARVRLLRDSVVVCEGKIGSLKRFKDDAREVQEGYECGIGIDGYQDIKPSDVIEAFIVEESAETL